MKTKQFLFMSAAALIMASCGGAKPEEAAETHETAPVETTEPAPAEPTVDTSAVDTAAQHTDAPAH